MFKSVLAIILAVLFPSAFAVITISSAGETPAGSISAERQLILRDMRTAVEAMSVSEKKGEKLQAAKVVEESIFRYSDPQRQIIDRRF